MEEDGDGICEFSMFDGCEIYEDLSKINGLGWSDDRHRIVGGRSEDDWRVIGGGWGVESVNFRVSIDVRSKRIDRNSTAWGWSDDRRMMVGGLLEGGWRRMGMESVNFRVSMDVRSKRINRKSMVWGWSHDRRMIVGGWSEDGRSLVGGGWGWNR